MRNVVLILIALALGGVALFLIFNILKSGNSTPPQVDTPQAEAPATTSNSDADFDVIYVARANRDLYAGQLVTIDDIDIAPWPASSKDPSFIQAPSPEGVEITFTSMPEWYLSEDVSAYSPLNLDLLSPTKPQPQQQEVEQDALPEGAIVLDVDQVSQTVGQGYNLVDIYLEMKSAQLLGTAGTWNRLRLLAKNVPIERKMNASSIDTTAVAGTVGAIDPFAQNVAQEPETTYYLLLSPETKELISLNAESGKVKISPSNLDEISSLNNLCVGDRCFLYQPPEDASASPEEANEVDPNQDPNNSPFGNDNFGNNPDNLNDYGQPGGF